MLLSPQEIYRVNLLDCLKSFVDDISHEGGEMPTTIFRDMITRRNNLVDCLKSFVDDISLEGSEMPTTVFRTHSERSYASGRGKTDVC